MIDAAKILQFFAKGNRLLDVQTKVNAKGTAPTTIVAEVASSKDGCCIINKKRH